MKANFLRLLIALLCLQAGWAQALHLSHAGADHDTRSHAAADHSGHAHESSDATHDVADAPAECQQQHHHHASCVALIDRGQLTPQIQSSALLNSHLNHSQARLVLPDIDRPKWPATTF